MLVSHLYEEIKEKTGSCDQKVNFRTLTRAIQLLSSGGLFDPQLGTLTLRVEGAYNVALPRDVRAPIRINIDGNPSFSRSRIFEFEMNSVTSEGEETGWQWHDRGTSPVTFVDHQPTKVAYRTTHPNDNGKTLTIRGINRAGREVVERLTGLMAGAQPSENLFARILHIHREETERDTHLEGVSPVEGQPVPPPPPPGQDPIPPTLVGPLARYYPDETEPSYRVIKLSKTGVAIKVRYRKHVFEIKSLEDVIPVDSAMAVLMAVDAVRMMMRRENEQALPVLEAARRMLQDEQDANNEGVDAALAGTEVQTSANRTINHKDLILVADIYDDASDIVGRIGQPKLFDRITEAVEILERKTGWESSMGMCDVDKSNFCGDLNLDGSKGHGYFVLPRYVHSVLQVNVEGQPTIPRNRWFTFHLNGTGERHMASARTFDDLGYVATINRLPIRLARDSEKPTFDSTTAFTFDSTIWPTFDNTGVPRYKGQGFRIVPQWVLATCELEADKDAVVRIYGLEEKEDGQIVEVYRHGQPGWVCPCKTNPTQNDLGSDAPKFVRIDRILRQPTKGFVSLKTFDPSPLLLGYWYPDETEPSYRLLKIDRCQKARVTLRYRKRAAKIVSLDDPLNLRSRTAIKLAMMALAKMGTETELAMTLEAKAASLLVEEEGSTYPLVSSSLQFDPGTCPAHTENIE